MKLTTTSTVAALAITAACAQSPSEIQPVSMGGSFDGITCSHARTMMASERQELSGLSAAQNGAVMGDAIGVLLIGVPVSSLSGADRAGDIATAKGKIVALDARLVRC